MTCYDVTSREAVFAVLFWTSQPCMYVYQQFPFIITSAFARLTRLGNTLLKGNLLKYNIELGERGTTRSSRLSLNFHYR